MRSASKAIPMLAGVSLLAMLGSLLVGSTPIAVSRLWHALFSPNDPKTDGLRFILFEIRAPRVIVGFLVGMALGSGGCASQALFRNPLADPSVLGVSACAALAAQAVIFSGLSQFAPWVVVLAASLGAALAMLALMGLLGDVRGAALESVVLGGIALGQLAVAVSAVLVSFALANYSIARRLLSWMLGTLDGRSWLHVAWGVGPILVGIAWLCLRARELDASLLGDATAFGLGVDMGRRRRELLLVTAMLSGVTVAIGGIVSFVGLVVPHALRRAFGASHATLLPASALGGGVFVVMADLIARRAIAPQELQLGVVTAAVGGPWFVVMLHRRLREKLA